MEEIEDEIKDHFGEHQLKIETDPDHAGRAERPVRRQQADRGEAVRPRSGELRRAGRGGRRDAGEEGQGPRHQGGQQQRLRGQSRPDDPGGRGAGRPARAEAGRGRAAVEGDVSGPDRRPGARSRRCASPTSASAIPTRSASARAGSIPTLRPAISGSCCPKATPTPPARRCRMAGPAPRPCRCRRWPTSTPMRTPDEQWRENQQPAVFVTAELNEEEAGLGSVVADIRRWMAEVHAAGRLPLGAGRPLPPAAGGLPEPAGRHGRGRSCWCSSCWPSSSARWCCRC